MGSDRVCLFRAAQESAFRTARLLSFFDESCPVCRVLSFSFDSRGGHMATRQLAVQVAPPQQDQSNKRPVWIFVLIDALGWRYVDGTPFLEEELEYRKPLRTILGFSSGAIPTILTGVPPAQNGHWNLFYYDPDGSPFRWMRWLNFLPDSILDHRVTRK